LRHVLWYLLPHIFALIAFTVFYGIYNNVRQQYSKESITKTRFFLQPFEIVQVSKSGRAISQYSLASKKFWERRKQQPKKIPTVSKTIKIPSMDLIIKEILSFVTRDFVSSWYNPSISTNPEFLINIEFILNNAASELYSRVETIDVAQLILIKITGILTVHAREFQNAERLLRASRIPNIKDKDTLDRLLAQHYLQGKLHPAVPITAADTIETEYQYLRKKLTPLIPLLIPRKDASSKMILALIRELLVTTLLRPIIHSFSDPDYWNQTFDCLGQYLLENHVQSNNVKKPSEFIANYGKDEIPSFENFLRDISNCETIPEANRIRDLILSEIQAKTAAISILC
jgi:sorting nexin-25